MVPVKVMPVPAEYVVLSSAAGFQVVPLYFNISPETGAVVERVFPCNWLAFQSAVEFCAENWVPPVKVKPVPAL